MPSRRQTSRRELLRVLAQTFREHRLFIYATSIGFRALVSLIPLVLLALGLLGALGLKETWHKSIAPEIRPHVTPPVFHAIDFSAEKILASGTAPLIVFAAVLVLWDLTLAMSAAMEALNRIHDVKEGRSFGRRAATASALALVSSSCLIGSILIVTVAPRVTAGAADVVLGIARWAAAIMLLALAVGLVVHFGPAERPEKRWASAGSLLVIVVWVGASFLFKLWVTAIADFKSAIGSLAVLLFLTTYVFVTAAIFLVGAQLDELLRKEAHHEGPGLLQLVQGRIGH